MEEVMPIYEYQCSECKHSCELLEKVDAPQVQKCPKCGHNTLKRQISNTSFQLKGSGWYVTDFRGDKKSDTKKDNKES